LSTPYSDVVGPGALYANPDEALLTPATGTTLTREQIKAFQDSGEALGATDDGLEFSYSPDFEEDTYAGVPGNVRGGRKLTSAEISISGAFTEIRRENMMKFVPNSRSEPWEVGASGSEVEIGDIITFDSTILDSDYIDSLALIGERKGTGLPIVIFIYNAINAEDFTLSLNGDQTRSDTDVSFMATYGPNTFNEDTGEFQMPAKLYLPKPAVPVT
jgi:hypothetical protein